MNFRAINTTIDAWQHHPASKGAKILSLPVLIPMLIFFTIRDNVLLTLCIVSVGIIVATTGCAGFDEYRENLYSMQYRIMQAEEAQAENIRAQTWQQGEQFRQTQYQQQQQARKLCVSADGQRMVQC